MDFVDSCCGALLAMFSQYFVHFLLNKDQCNLKGELGKNIFLEKIISSLPFAYSHPSFFILTHPHEKVYKRA